MFSRCVIRKQPTESTKDRVRETISNGKLPLRGDNQTKGCDKEEIGDEYIIGCDAAPFHETQREGCQGCSECAQS